MPGCLRGGAAGRDGGYDTLAHICEPANREVGYDQLSAGALFAPGRSGQCRRPGADPEAPPAELGRSAASHSRLIENSNPAHQKNRTQRLPEVTILMRFTPRGV